MRTRAGGWGLWMALLLLLPLAASWSHRPAMAAGAVRVEAENYSRYLDTEETNLGDSQAYRNPGPDVYACAACSNGNRIGAFSSFNGTPEWLEYDLSVPQSGAYSVVAQYGTRSTGAAARLDVDGATVATAVALPSTGHYSTMASQTLGSVTLGAGVHRIRLYALGPYSLDYLELRPGGGAPVPTATPQATAAPTSVPVGTSTPVPPSAGSSSAVAWQRWEATLTSARSYGNPYADVTVEVAFRGPSGQTLRSFAFWDGGGSFRVRAMFPAAGTWTWQTIASDTTNSGLHNRSGTVNVAAPSGSNPLYSRGGLRVSTDGRYLTYADGTPFLWLGDTAWTAPLSASQANWETYVNDRAAKKFSVLMVAPSPAWGGTQDTTGNPPWNGTVGTQWNPGYWQGLERKVQYANSRGLVVMLVGVMEPNGSNLPDGVAQRFARQIVGRLHGNHVIFAPSFDSPYESFGNTIGAEIDRATDLHLITQHPNTPSGQVTNVTADNYYGQSYLSFSGNQSGHNGGNRERNASQEITWNLSLDRRTPGKPVINLEGFYDANGTTAGLDAKYQGTAKDVRAGGYRSWLSGALGYSYGAYGLWNWKNDSAGYRWDRAMAYPSSTQMTYLRDLLAGLPWHTLQPDHGRLRNQPAAWTDRAVFAITADRRSGLAYTPVARAITLDMSAFSGTVRTTWVNPVTNQRTTGPSAINSGVVSFTPPAGGDDWVLLLQP